jgi:hypothetical protein
MGAQSHGSEAHSLGYDRRVAEADVSFGRSQPVALLARKKPQAFDLAKAA